MGREGTRGANRPTHCGVSVSHSGVFYSRILFKTESLLCDVVKVTV